MSDEKAWICSRRRSSQPAPVGRPLLHTGQAINFPVEWTKDDKTGKYVPSENETKPTGVIITMSARPTANPHRIELDIEAVIREFLGFTKERVKVDDPHAPQSLPGARFTSRMHQFNGEFQNGSYFIIGQRDDSQTVEDSVPVLGDIPLLGRLFRTSQTQKFRRLAAVQVIVSEAVD